MKKHTFIHHKIGNKHEIRIRNLIMIFFSILIGLGSIIVFADLQVQTNLSNAVQTIQRIIISTDGSDIVANRLYDINSDGNGSIKIYTENLNPGINKTVDDMTSLTNRGVLGINKDSNNVIIIPKESLGSGGVGGTTIIQGGSRDYILSYPNKILPAVGSIGLGFGFDELGSFQIDSLALATDPLLPPDPLVLDRCVYVDNNGSLYAADCGIYNYDQCLDNPELCSLTGDICLEDPTLCYDICTENPELCEDPCTSNPSLCELTGDICLEDPQLCVDICTEDPTLCEFSMGDNLGDHIAIDNIQLQGYSIVYSGDYLSNNDGIYITESGNISIGDYMNIRPDTAKLTIDGDIKIGNNGLYDEECTGDIEGKIRYMDGCFQGCDGDSRNDMAGLGCYFLPYSTCSLSLPSHSIPTATSQTWRDERNYSIEPGICTYTCEAGYIYIESDEACIRQGFSGATINNLTGLVQNIISGINISGDNLGNHTATTGLRLNNNRLSNNGGNKGIRIDNNGNIGINIDPFDRSPVTPFSLSINGYTTISGNLYSKNLNVNSLINTNRLMINGLANSGNKCLYIDNMGEVKKSSFDCSNGTGILRTGIGDNLGNHTASGNIKLNNYRLSNDGDDEGIIINNNGGVGVGINPINSLVALLVSGDTNINGLLSGVRGLFTSLKTPNDVAPLVEDNKCVYVDKYGELHRSTTFDCSIAGGGAGGGDNLGNHTATTGIKTNGNRISSDGDPEGIFIDNAGNIIFSQNSINGNGSKFMRLAGKGAIRAGSVNSTQRDYDNIGNNSIAFGRNNKVPGTGSAIIGGSNNLMGAIASNYSFIGGGELNTLVGNYSFIGGGYSNIVSGLSNTVGGGSFNTGAGSYTTIGGGNSNKTIGMYSTIGGGAINKTIGLKSTIGGGENNTTSGDYGTIGGGTNNRAMGNNSTIGGGQGNYIGLGIYSIIGGGLSNRINGTGSIIPGGSNNILTGDYSIILGGNNNSINGSHSIVAGKSAQVNHDYTFLFNLSPFSFSSSKSGTFLVNAPNGVGINTNNPNATLSLSGSLAITVTVISGNYSYPSLAYLVKSTDQTIVGAGMGNIYVKLPAIQPDNQYRIITLKRYGTPGGININVDNLSTETIDGFTGIWLGHRQAVTITNNGTNTRYVTSFFNGGYYPDHPNQGPYPF